MAPLTVRQVPAAMIGRLNHVLQLHDMIGVDVGDGLTPVQQMELFQSSQIQFTRELTAHMRDSRRLGDVLTTLSHRPSSMTDFASLQLQVSRDRHSSAAQAVAVLEDVEARLHHVAIALEQGLEAIVSAIQDRSAARAVPRTADPGFVFGPSPSRAVAAPAPSFRVPPGRQADPIVVSSPAASSLMGGEDELGEDDLVPLDGPDEDVEDEVAAGGSAGVTTARTFTRKAEIRKRDECRPAIRQPGAGTA
ncbi:hypothetical protein MBLNU459_g4961t2 [Dothideomycetes sp. NU459]